MIPRAGEGGWGKPTREHWDSVNAFIRAVEGIPPDSWGARPGHARWSPAQVAEHVLRGYQVALDQLRGGAPMRRKAGPLQQRLLRWFLLPHIIFHRSIPLRAGAPREVLPSETGVGQRELAGLLREVAAELEREFRGTSRTHLIHPYFGPIPIRRAMRFVAAHTEHHRKHLGKSRSPAAPCEGLTP